MAGYPHAASMRPQVKGEQIDEDLRLLPSDVRHSSRVGANGSRRALLQPSNRYNTIRGRTRASGGPAGAQPDRNTKLQGPAATAGTTVRVNGPLGVGISTE